MWTRLRMRHKNVPPIQCIHQTIRNLWKRSQCNTLSIEFRFSFIVVVTHAAVGAETNRSLDHHHHRSCLTLGVILPAPWRRQRRGRALRLHCSPQQLDLCSFSWWLQGIRSAPKTTWKHSFPQTRTIKGTVMVMWGLPNFHHEGIRKKSTFDFCLHDIYFLFLQCCIA